MDNNISNLRQLTKMTGFESTGTHHPHEAGPVFVDPATVVVIDTALGCEPACSTLHFRPDAGTFSLRGYIVTVLGDAESVRDALA